MTRRAENDVDLTIERCQGATYKWDGETYAVYASSVYPDSSVNAGQECRTFLDSSTDVEQLKRDFPQARVIDGTTYVPIEIPHTPPDWFDPDYAGERWDDDY